MSSNLKVFITGGSKGIGRALALEYAEKNAELFLFARNESALEELTRFINTHNGKASFFAGDITQKDDVKDAILKADDFMSGIDVAVLNAGISEYMGLRNYNSDNLKEILDVNLLGNAFCLEYLIPIMKSQKSGKIIGVSSIASFRTVPGSSSYAISKIGLDYLLEAARYELKDLNIRVITCRFGFIKTDIIKKNDFYMPFLLEPDVAARKIINGIEQNKKKIQFPIIMLLLTKILRLLPEFIYEKIVKFRIKD